MVNNLNFVKFASGKTSAIKSQSNFDNWIAFNLEWEDANTKNNDFSIFNSLGKNASGGSVPPVFHNKIVTFGFEDSYGNSGSYDTTEFDS